jgi:hypothetical protein
LINLTQRCDVTSQRLPLLLLLMRDWGRTGQFASNSPPLPDHTPRVTFN